jgi:hypothetical protein
MDLHRTDEERSGLGCLGALLGLGLITAMRGGSDGLPPDRGMSDGGMPPWELIPPPELFDDPEEWGEDSDELP